jgi:hypothetical protein
MKAKEIIDESKWGLLGKLLQKGSGAAKTAAPLASKIIGAAARNPIKSTAAAATAYNYYKDPDRANKDLPTAVGDALGKTARQAWNLGSAAVSSAFKDDDTAVATTPSGRTDSTQAVKPSSNKPEKEFAHGDDQPVRAPEPDSDSNSGSYVRDMERRIEQRYKSWPEQQNESVKKKFAVTEADKVDLDKELEQHFPDPYVRRAIAAKISRESGGKNVGEVSYRNTRNDRIREKLPQLRKLSDTELNALKQDDKKFFDRAYSKIGGYQYRGRGPIQLTGKSRYAEIDKQLGLNGKLLNDPDLILKDPEIAKAATIQYLKNAGLNKTYKNQKDAHRAVIAAIGGSAYAPGTQLGKSELAAISGITGDTKIAGVPKGGGAKPSSDVAKPSSDVVKPMRGPNGEPLVQMPDFSLGFKVGDKFVPQTRQGYGQPVDYAGTHAKAKSSMGISPDEALRQSNDELLARRAAVQRMPTRSIIEPVSVVPKTPAKEPEKKLEPTTNVIPPFSMTNTPTEPEVRKPDGAWDKFINTVTVGRVPAEEKERMQVPESINKEIQDILRLSGKR